MNHVDGEATPSLDSWWCQLFCVSSAMQTYGGKSKHLYTWGAIDVVTSISSGDSTYSCGCCQILLHR